MIRKKLSSLTEAENSVAGAVDVRVVQDDDLFAHGPLRLAAPGLHVGQSAALAVVFADTYPDVGVGAVGDLLEVDIRHSLPYGERLAHDLDLSVTQRSVRQVEMLLAIRVGVVELEGRARPGERPAGTVGP